MVGVESEAEEDTTWILERGNRIMEQRTTTTKAWNGGITAGLVSGLLPIIERTWMVDFPPELESAIIALVTAVGTWWMVYLFPNKPIEEKPE